MGIIENAKNIATEAHKGVFRKWTKNNDPYIVHPARIANKLMTMPGTNEVDYAAAWLHDVIEDVAIPNNLVDHYNNLIREQCGQDVLDLVWELTNPTEGPEWKGKPREEKRKADWEHLILISNRAKRIKMVDRWDNVRDSSHAPKKWAAKYVPESYHLAKLCEIADPDMAKELVEAIDEFKKRIKV